jgi:hypothetical protein
MFDRQQKHVPVAGGASFIGSQHVRNDLEHTLTGRKHV